MLHYDHHAGNRLAFRIVGWRSSRLRRGQEIQTFLLLLRFIRQFTDLRTDTNGKKISKNKAARSWAKLIVRCARPWGLLVCKERTRANEWARPEPNGGRITMLSRIRRVAANLERKSWLVIAYITFYRSANVLTSRVQKLNVCSLRLTVKQLKVL